MEKKELLEACEVCNKYLKPYDMGTVPFDEFMFWLKSAVAVGDSFEGLSPTELGVTMADVIYKLCNLDNGLLLDLFE